MAPEREAATHLAVAQLADSAFPSGGFAFSQGLEALLAEGMVAGEAGVGAFLRQHMHHRWLVFDRWFLLSAHACADSDAELFALDREMEAMSLSAGLREGSARNGLALLTAHARLGTGGAERYRQAVIAGTVPGHLAVAQGAMLRGCGLAPLAAQAVAAHAAMMALVTAAVRLGAIGTLAGQRLVRQFQPDIAAALAEPPGEPWCFTPLAEIAAMRHETQTLRLFST